MNSDYRRLGQYVLRRRQELQLSQTQVREFGGPSNSTMTTLEAGEATTVSPATLRKLDTALQWEPGSARNVLGGAEPTPAQTISRPDDEHPDVSEAQLLDFIARYSAARAETVQVGFLYAAARNLTLEDAFHELDTAADAAFNSRKDPGSWIPPWRHYDEGEQ